MRRKKSWVMPKPVFTDLFLKIFLSVLALAGAVLFFTMRSKLENRHTEMQAALAYARAESLRYESSYGSVVSQNNDTSGSVPGQIYSGYINAVEYFALNSRFPTAIVDPVGEDGTPQIIMDNFSPKVFCVYINDKDSDSYFPNSCYRLYEDDPELSEFLNRTIDNPNMQYWYSAETVYVREQTNEFVPESVQWANYETGEMLETYSRKLEIPGGFVKDEKRNTIALMPEVCTNYAYETDGKWYEPMDEYGNGIQIRYGGDAAKQLQEDIQNGYFYDRMIESGLFGTRYCAQIDTIQLLDEHGEPHDYRLIRAMQYNLGEYYWKSIVVTVLYCVLAVLVFSGVVAYIIFLKKYNTWQQNAFCRTLTNAVAHDLKTPLMVVSGMADNLKECVTDDKQKYYAEQVTDAVEYMNRMIEDILDLNRIEGNKPILRREQVNLEQLLEEVKGSVQAIIEDKKLDYSIQGTGQCDGDYALLRQAFGNLVDNAAKYTPDGGKIRIEIDKRSVRITNTGVTLSKKFIRNAFDPFTKKDKARGNRNGSGVGLAIAKSIFDAHGMKCLMKSNTESVQVIVRWK